MPSADRGAVNAKSIAKIMLARLGRFCSERFVYNLNGIFNYLYVGWWLHAHGFRPSVTLASREAIFRRMATDIGDRVVLYLEFGVASGASMRQWSQLLRNPRSCLHGFDSFLGLPHDWSLEGHPRGYFDRGGRPPQVDDPRVRFVVGWFNETLPSYEWPAHEVLVLMLDADLYTSTAFVLDHVKDKLVPGSYLYFDQFHHRCDELRAFTELLDETSLRFELVAASADLTNLAFRRIP